jgi:PHD/YefM family antitoxin component YafN of YafNO toxin-antitoxin module
MKLGRVGMNVSTSAIVSNSEMIKNYKTCREKAERQGKVFVLKNNQPDAVLFSIAEYERLAVFIEYLESLDEKGAEQFLRSLPKEGMRKRYSFDQLVADLSQA